MKNKSIILLSGGLDSVVSLAAVKDNCSDILALTFNYGQKSFDSEKKASSDIAKYYAIQHKIVDLPWLCEISTSSLNTLEPVPSISMENLDSSITAKKTAQSVWVPNRNALFTNIAASFAEALKYDLIVIGANKEEGALFKDNTPEFVQAINNSFKNSLNSKVSLSAPLLKLSKYEIVKMGITLSVPFELIYSCYVNGEKHCGKCESCMRLRRALELNNAQDVIDRLF